MAANTIKKNTKEEQCRKAIDLFSTWVRITLIFGLTMIITLFTNNNLYIFTSAIGLMASLGFTSLLWFKKILPLKQ